MTLLLLAACNTTPNSSEIPPGTPAASGPAPAYREPAQAITPDNASQLTLLGRLDAPAGSTSSIFSFSFSPDGTRLVALNTELLMSWDLVTGQLLFSASSRSATRVMYSPDKTEIYTLNPEGFVIVYGEEGTEKTTLEGHERYNGTNAYFALEGWLAIAGDNGEVKVWNPLERTSLVTFRAHSGPVERVVFSADGERLGTAGDFKAKIWDWRNRTLLQEFDLQGKPPSGLTFSPDGMQLAVSSPDVVAIFDTTNGTRLHTLPVPEGGASEFLSYTPDGRYLVTAGAAAGMTFWNPQTGAVIGELPEVTGNRVAGAFSPSGELLVTSVLDKSAGLWNLSKITEQAVFGVTLEAGTKRIVNVGWSDDGFVIAFFDVAGASYIMGIPGE